MNLLQMLRGGDEARSSWDTYLQQLSSFQFNGLSYGHGIQQTLPGQAAESIDSSFVGYVRGAYKANGPVFATMLVRQLIFSEARFQFRQIHHGRPGDLFGSAALRLLEKPWPNGTTGELLTRMIQDADLAGNFYATNRGGRIRRLRPDWVTIVLGSQLHRDQGADALDAEVVGYLYKPGGASSRHDQEILLVDEVAHWSPIPDPEAHYRGMSWLTPVIREIQADSAATTHKLKFFENGATPNMVVSFDKEVGPEKAAQFREKLESKHRGVRNAYKTLYLGGGADVEVVGANFKELDFKVTQGAGETRIAAAGGVPPVLVGLSEGLDSATYSNYGQARRRFGDGTMRPLWRSGAAALAPLVAVPDSAELWYDDTDIPFLREDVKDAAEARGVDARTVRTYTDAGFTPESAVKAVSSGDVTHLQHTGLFSVQLQKPGADASRAITVSGEAAVALIADGWVPLPKPEPEQEP